VGPYFVTLDRVRSRGIGCMDVVEALLPCLKMKPKYFILQNINQSKNIYCI
jgi:hypothetical protein